MLGNGPMSWEEQSNWRGGPCKGAPVIASTDL